MAGRFRGMGIGLPGSAKSGAVACLVNTGKFKLRCINMDGNLASLEQFIEPKFHANVDVVMIQDELRVVGEQVKFKGDKPRGYMKVLDLLTHWKHGDVDFGPVGEWGPDTILMLDPLTKFGDMAMNRTLYLNNRTPQTRRIQDWGTAASMQEDGIQIFSAPNIHCHIYCPAHLRLIGPDLGNTNDSDEVKAVKVDRADMIPTRWYPKALGQSLPQSIGQYFDYVLLFETIIKGGKPTRVIHTAPRTDVDIKCPLTNIEDTLSPATGLLTIFEKAGYV